MAHLLLQSGFLRVRIGSEFDGSATGAPAPLQARRRPLAAKRHVDSTVHGPTPPSSLLVLGTIARSFADCAG